MNEEIAPPCNCNIIQTIKFIIFRPPNVYVFGKSCKIMTTYKGFPWKRVKFSHPKLGTSMASDYVGSCGIFLLKLFNKRSVYSGVHTIYICMYIWAHEYYIDVHLVVRRRQTRRVRAKVSTVVWGDLTRVINFYDRIVYLCTLQCDIFLLCMIAIFSSCVSMFAFIRRFGEKASWNKKNGVGKFKNVFAFVIS